MSSSLHNYLRMHRKHAGFTQQEVAALLGVRRDTVRGHENRVEPALDVAIGYEILYGSPIKKLFEGRYEEVEAHVRSVAKEQFDQVKSHSGNERPLCFDRLSQIANPFDPVINATPWDDEV